VGKQLIGIWGKTAALSSLLSEVPQRLLEPIDIVAVVVRRGGRP